MLLLQSISYTHPNKDLLFSDINLSVQKGQKIALIGNNGMGKSILLKIIAKELFPTTGELIVETDLYSVPQILEQYNSFTIAQALQVDRKINALNEIIDGNTSDENFQLLDDDWTIEDRCREALAYWDLAHLDLSERLETLSGGQKTKVFLAGISIHQPGLILLDEPSNHLDSSARQLLYDFIQSTKCTLIVVSHDRQLLNLLDSVCELGRDGITVYGGNFSFYKEQKQIEKNALNQDLQSKEKAFRKAKEKERETIERQQKLDSRGKAKQEKAGVAKIMMNTFRNNAENSTSKLKKVHGDKLAGITKELKELRSSLPAIDKMKLGFEQSSLHKGKILYTAKNINFTYERKQVWRESMDFQILNGERIALKGENGSGKTTLLKLIAGEIDPQIGTVSRAFRQWMYIDQNYSTLDSKLKIYEQAAQFNTSALQEHEIKIMLNHFLFTKEDWEKSCGILSGGERMRLLLCCLAISSKSPELIILDEPTNNLDIQNVEILTTAINQYRGTLIVVSHDEFFLKEIQIQRTINL